MNITVKNKDEYKIMNEGGKKLAEVKSALKKNIKANISAKEIDDLADELIVKLGAKPSFKMVPKYSWATCVNVGSGIVHGIPHKHIVFKKGDIVSVDVGLYYKGFHSDTSFTIGIEIDEKVKNFLSIGKKALKLAIAQAKPGRRIYDISDAIEKTVKREGYTPVRALVGHGIGRELHEDPHIPCYTEGERDKSPVIQAGNAFAIEVMYAQGGHALKVEDDNWTISMRDGKISALFEDTVFITGNGPKVLTE
jgi:methionyl aminopeptidase